MRSRRHSLRNIASRFTEVLIEHDRITIFIVILALLITYGIKIYTENENATGGHILLNYSQQTEKLKIQNALLKQEILEKSSLRVIRSEAYQRGFIECSTCQIILKL